MKFNRFIICYIICSLVLSLSFANAQTNPYRFRLQQDIKEHLLKYLYEIGAARDSIPPVFTLSEEEREAGWILADSSYMHIQDMMSGDEIVENSDLEYYGIYAFYPLYSSHADIYMFLKFDNECEVICPGASWKPHAQIDLGLQLRQVLNYFDKHNELDSRLLSFYIQSVCKVYDENSQMH